MADKKTEAADPFANLKAEPVDKLFNEATGRPATPVPDSVKALVAQSYGDGKATKPLRVPVTDEAQAKTLRKLLGKAAEQHEPVITVRTTFEKNGDAVVAVRFQAGPKIARKTAEAKPEGNGDNGKAA